MHAAVSFPRVSEFISLLSSLKRPPAGLRQLTAREIAALERQGNRAEDWKLLRVARDFIPDCIMGCLFRGSCRLGRFSGVSRDAGGAGLPSGLYHSTLLDAWIGDEALVHRAPLLAGWLVGEGAVVQASSLVHTGRSSFGNGLRIKAGLENGGRTVTAFADMDPETAEAMARGQLDGDAVFQAGLRGFLAEVESGRSLLAAGSRVTDCRRVENACIGVQVEMCGAELVRDCSIIGLPDAPTRIGSGAIVESSIMQPGSEASGQAIVRRSILATHASVGSQAKVSESYIGSFTVIAEGEASSCFLGPLIGFHHQSLLIAAFWPGGRGNVGSGANVGSNHTSRAPDQEMLAGQGMFFGLGCSVKYPANFEASPWSIIASGVCTPPQLLAFPFSLIMEADPAAGAPAGCCRLSPAWVLRENLYMVFRSEQKFHARGRGLVGHEVFGPDTVAWMLQAASRLEDAPAGLLFYSSRDVTGLGKNYLPAVDRLPAAQAYRYWARFACLRRLVGLLTARLSGGLRPDFPACARRPGGLEPAWLKLLDAAGLLKESLPQLLDEFEGFFPVILDGVRRSREKDHVRGSRDIPDYARTHAGLDDDEILINLKKDLAGQRRALDALRGRP
jgi:hypothetical protein